jgi:hypothetical protein
MSDRTEKLMKLDPDMIPNLVLKEALKEAQRRESEALKEAAVVHLMDAANVTQTAVKRLRKARKEAKRQEDYLEDVSAAEVAYQTNGNWEAYLAAVQEGEQAYFKAKNADRS